jgi:hypothetical protein
MRVQRTRSSASPPHSPLTRSPLGSEGMCVGLLACPTKGVLMEGWKANVARLALLLVIGIGSIVRFSEGVRLVAVVGISGGGAACGVALFGSIFRLVSKSKA